MGKRGADQEHPRLMAAWAEQGGFLLSCLWPCVLMSVLGLGGRLLHAVCTPEMALLCFSSILFSALSAGEGL